MRDPNRYLLPVYAVVLCLVAALFLWGLLARGGRADGGWSRSPNEIIFCGWGGPEEKATFTRLVREFEKLNPDIRVRYILVPQNYMQKLQIMMAGGTPPDVFYIPDLDFPAFVVKGAMESLSPYVRGSRVIVEKDFWPSALSRYRYDGRNLGKGDLYALPKDIGPFAMFYNKDLFRKAGLPYPSAEVPMTWDEAIRVWKKLTVEDARHPGVVEQFGVANFTWESAVWSLGGEVLSPDGRRFVMPDDPRSVEGLQWVADISLKHKCAPNPRQARSFDPGPMFDTGKLACIIAGRWMVPHYRTLDFDWDVAPIPVHPVTRRPAGWSGSVGFAMARTSPNKQAAWRFIEFLAGPHGQAVQAATGFQIPNQRALAYTDAFLQRDQRPRHAEVFIQGAIHQRPGIGTYAPTNEWLNEFGQRLTPMWEGRMTASEALKRMQPAVQKALDESWHADGG